MWPSNNPFYNPYQHSVPAYTTPQQVVRVNGRNGAEAYSIGANSSALLLDESGTVVWAITTDGAGYKTIVPYDIVPHQSQEEKTMSSFEERLSRLEALVHGTEDTATA